jgi:hypothetical protein
MKFIYLIRSLQRILERQLQRSKIPSSTARVTATYHRRYHTSSGYSEISKPSTAILKPLSKNEYKKHLVQQGHISLKL